MAGNATTARSNALAIVSDRLAEAIEAKKCHACGCFQAAGAALEQTEAGRRELAAALARARETFAPRKYDCLGCEVCFPSVAENAFAEAFPGEARAPPCPADAPAERSGWPPLLVTMQGGAPMKPVETSRAVLRPLSTIALITALALAPLPAPPRAAAQEIEFPETGTPGERAKKLWKASRSHVLADAKAALGDAEYQKRRAPLWNAWTRLQMSIAGEDDKVSRLIPDVLRLLNDTYGWTADPPAKRQEIRDRKRAFTEERVAEIDERVEALK